MVEQYPLKVTVRGPSPLRLTYPFNRLRSKSGKGRGGITIEAMSNPSALTLGLKNERFLHNPHF